MSGGVVIKAPDFLFLHIFHDFAGRMRTSSTREIHGGGIHGGGIFWSRGRRVSMPVQALPCFVLLFRNGNFLIFPPEQPFILHFPGMQGIIRTSYQNPVVIPAPERAVRTMGERPVIEVSSIGKGEVPHFPHPFSAWVKQVVHFRKNLGRSRLPISVFPDGDRHGTVIHLHRAKAPFPVFRRPPAVKRHPRYGTVQMDFQGLPSAFLLPCGVRNHPQTVPCRFQHARIPGQKARCEITVAGLPGRRKVFRHRSRSVQHLFHGQMFRGTTGSAYVTAAHAARIIPC